MPPRHRRIIPGDYPLGIKTRWNTWGETSIIPNNNNTSAGQNTLRRCYFLALLDFGCKDKVSVYAGSWSLMPHDYWVQKGFKKTGFLGHPEARKHAGSVITPERDESGADRSALRRMESSCDL